MWWLFYLFSFRDKTNCFHKPCTQNTTASYFCLTTFYFSTCVSPFRVSFCKNIILTTLSERGRYKGFDLQNKSCVLPQKFVTVSVEAEIIYSIWVHDFASTLKNRFVILFLITSIYFIYMP